MEVPPLTILPGEGGKEEEVYPGRRSPGGVGGEKGDRSVGGEGMASEGHQLSLSSVSFMLSFNVSLVIWTSA